MVWRVLGLVALVGRINPYLKGCFHVLSPCQRHQVVMERDGVVCVDGVLFFFERGLVVRGIV